MTYFIGQRSLTVANKEYDDATIARWNAAAKKARENSAQSEVTGK